MKLPITLKPVKNRAETLNFGKFLNIFSEFKEGSKINNYYSFVFLLLLLNRDSLHPRLSRYYQVELQGK